MDLRYFVCDKQDSAEGAVIGEKTTYTCAVSSQSLVAFTRLQLCPDSHNHQRGVYVVCVADLNSPYHSHVIVESSDKISRLQFNGDGNQLLVATQHGSLRVYSKGPGSLQDWTVIGRATCNEEEILLADFFHMGVRPTIQIGEVKLNSAYSDKFHMLPHKATLVGPGNCPICGVFAITTSGLLVVVAVWQPGVVEVVKAVLGVTREHLVTASVAFAPDGSVHIATWKPDMVKCWRLTLTHSSSQKRTENGNGTSVADSADVETDTEEAANIRLTLSVEPAQMFSPQCLVADVKARTSAANPAASGDGKPTGTDGGNPRNTLDKRKVLRVHYPYSEDPSILIVVVVDDVQQKGSQDAAGQPQGRASAKASSKGTWLVQKYHLEEKSKPVLNIFATTVEVPKSVTVKEWVCVGEWVSTSPVRCVGSARRYLLPGTHLPHVMTVATTDGTVTTINLDTMLMLASYNLHSARSNTDDAPRPVKRPASSQSHLYGIHLVHTWPGLSLLVLDNQGSLYFFSLMKPTDIGSSWPLCVLLLLEYSLVSGNDWWELLINTPPSSAVTLTDRLADTLSQHPASVVTHFTTRMLMLKAAVLSLTNNHHQATHARIQPHLTAILNLFRAFRPVTCDAMNPDKCSSVALQTFMESRSSLEQVDLDKAVDQFLYTVKLVDCQVDPKSAQDLQPLLQFTVELALYLLFMLAQSGKNELLKDSKTIQYMREILFRARIWYRHNKLLTPQLFQKTATVDVWAQLYRLLTRLVQILPNEPDSAFVDECVLLQTQVVCTVMPLYLPSRGFLTTLHPSHLPFSVPSSVAASMTSNATPVQYHFNQPDHPPVSTTLGANYHLEGALPPSNPRDLLFYHYIPDGSPVQQCTRCWAIRTVERDIDSLWDQEWSSHCLCAGHWILVDPKSPVSAS